MRTMITVITPTATAMMGFGSHWYLDPILESEVCPSSMAVFALLIRIMVESGWRLWDTIYTRGSRF